MSSLVVALRRIAKGSRLSSLDVPLLEDAADKLEWFDQRCAWYAEELAKLADAARIDRHGS